MALLITELRLEPRKFLYFVFEKEDQPGLYDQMVHHGRSSVLNDTDI